MEAMANEQSAGVRAGPQTLPLGRPRILVAEDDLQMRALMAAVLRADGAEVVEADGGVDLLEWAELAAWTSQHHLFDAIISDIQMPDLTALDVLAKVPSITRNTKVILVTGLSDEETHRRAYDLGATVVLRKPLDPNDLRAVARSVVAH